MNRFILILVAAFVAPVAQAITCFWNNSTDGSWQVATNWTPPTVPGPGDIALVTNVGTYTVWITNNVTISALTLGGTGSPSLAVDNYATLACTNMVVTSGGTLICSNSWMNGALTIQSGGQLLCQAPGNTYIYSLNLTNQGTVTWSSGSLSVANTVINNSGLWQITGNGAVNNGGGAAIWINTGTLRKSAGNSTTSINAVNFFNPPGGLVDVLTGTLQLNGGSTNLLAGNFTTAATAVINLINGVWTDAGGGFPGPGTNTFSTGTFYLRTNVPTGLKFLGGDVYITGTQTFQQAGAITNLVLDGAALRGTNTIGAGVLTFNSGNIVDQLTILPAGQLTVGGTGGKLIYSSTIINQGTVVCGGSLNAGSTLIFNSGLWQITGDYDFSAGGYNYPIWTNSGIIRKTGGTGSFSQISANVVNLPGALVEVLAGRLIFAGGTGNQLGGTFNAVGLLDLNNGTWTDVGGVMTGVGTNRFLNGTLNLRTNLPPSLVLAGGTVFITGTNTFQNAGAITNLTLDGATLAGTNSVSGGSLTLNAGAINGQLTVQPDGQLTFATTASKFITLLTLFNQGKVVLSSDNVKTGSALIDNSGLWQIAGNYGLSTGGVGTTSLTNRGTFQKTAGTGSAVLSSGFNFYNQPGALVQVDAGTLQLPPGTTNFTGTLRLNGGTLTASGPVAVAGGIVDGAGTFGANTFTAGTVSPGVAGTGAMNFSAGLNLSANATLVLDGTGPIPGVTYDTLSVTGTVALSNCVLQITALPVVPAGTTFMLIANDGSDAVNGTFNGLPENALLTVGSQPFRIHYAGGTGNDVTLVRDGVVTGPLLTMQGYATNAWTFTGSNAIPLTAFTIRASTNLVTWTNIGVATSSISGALSFVDTNAWKYSFRFYRTTN